MGADAVTRRLVLACGAYDRTAPLADGRVTAAGIDLDVLLMDPEETFFRMVRHSEFDVAEMSLGTYCMMRARGVATSSRKASTDRFVGIPVFLSRSFRHNALYVRRDGPVGDPAALAGGRIGVPEYQMTAAVWIRGLMADDLGMDLAGLTWMTGGIEQPGREEREPLRLTDPSIAVERLTEGTLTEALVDGRIDAMMAPRAPSAFRNAPAGHDEAPLVRLLPDWAARERAAWDATGIFPIMHLVVIRREVHEADPWIARNLQVAFEAAKDLATADLADAPALRVSLPGLLEAVEAQREVYGADPWPYGLAANDHVLRRFMDLMVAQGLMAEPLDPADLFAPSTLQTSRI